MEGINTGISKQFLLEVKDIREDDYMINNDLNTYPGVEGFGTENELDVFGESEIPVT